MARVFGGSSFGVVGSLYTWKSRNMETVKKHYKRVQDATVPGVVFHVALELGLQGGGGGCGM